MTGPRLAIMATLEEIGGHRAVDELLLALRDAGFTHARTTVYNALDDLARVGLVRPAPVDAGALRYEITAGPHHHFVCRRCGKIRNVEILEDLVERKPPAIEGADVDEIDVVYRGMCHECVEQVAAGAPLSLGARHSETGRVSEGGHEHNGHTEREEEETNGHEAEYAHSYGRSEFAHV